jgi:hypothetical protein
VCISRVCLSRVCLSRACLSWGSSRPSGSRRRLHLPNMPFESQIFCNLLNGLSRAQTKTSSTVLEIADSSTNAWFDKHDSIIPCHGYEAVAFLSCMFPERRRQYLSRRRSAVALFICPMMLSVIWHRASNEKHMQSSFQ